jgi:hypothetical protein
MGIHKRYFVVKNWCEMISLKLSGKPKKMKLLFSVLVANQEQEALSESTLI